MANGGGLENHRTFGTAIFRPNRRCLGRVDQRSGASDRRLDDARHDRLRMGLINVTPATLRLQAKGRFLSGNRSPLDGGNAL